MCVQVCAYAGETKKGKNNAIGILLIHRLTFFANYLSPSYVLFADKKEFQKEFDKVIKYLR